MRCCLFGDYVFYFIIRQILIAFIVRLCFFFSVYLLLLTFTLLAGEVAENHFLRHKQGYS